MEIETGNFVAFNTLGVYDLIPKRDGNGHLWTLYDVQEKQNEAILEFQVDHNTNPRNPADVTSKIEYVTSPCESKASLLSLVGVAATFARLVSEEINKDPRIHNYCEYWKPLWQQGVIRFGDLRGKGVASGMPNGQDPGEFHIANINPKDFAPKLGFAVTHTADELADVVTGITALDCLTDSLSDKLFVSPAEPQITMGIMLSKIPYLMKSVGETDFSSTTLGDFVVTAQKLVKDIEAAISAFSRLPTVDKEEFLGFLCLLVMIVDADHKQVAEYRNAKTLSGALLSRGTFVYIFSLLSDEVKELIRTKFLLHGRSIPVLKQFGDYVAESLGISPTRSLYDRGLPLEGVGGTLWLDKPISEKKEDDIIDQKHNLVRGRHPPELRVSQWIQNFAKEEEPFDALQGGVTGPDGVHVKVHSSFYAQFDALPEPEEKEPYLDIIDDKFLLPVELRKMPHLPYDKWLPFASKVYDYMDVINEATDFLSEEENQIFKGTYTSYTGSIHGTEREEVEAPPQDDPELPSLDFRQIRRKNGLEKLKQRRRQHLSSKASTRDTVRSRGHQ